MYKQRIKVFSTKARRYVGILASEELGENTNSGRTSGTRKDMPSHSNKSGQHLPASKHAGYVFPTPRN